MDLQVPKGFRVIRVRLVFKEYPVFKGFKDSWDQRDPGEQMVWME